MPRHTADCEQGTHTVRMKTSLLDIQPLKKDLCLAYSIEAKFLNALG